MVIDDYAEVLDLWRAAEGVWVSDADSLERIDFYLKRNFGLSSVARHEGKIVGAVLCGHDGRRGFLHHLAVAPDWRRRAIGRELVERSLAALRSVGITRCLAFVFHDNAEGLRFWESVGWRDNPFGMALMIREIPDAS
jgi:N-acetylglutamate synthase